MGHEPATLRIVERVAGDVTVLDMAGRLVLADGDSVFRDRIGDLLARGRTCLVLNLKDVSYIDSAGVGVLVAKMLSIRRAGGDIKLLHLTTRSHRILTMTKLLSVFDTFDDEEEAIRSFGAGV